MADAVGRKNTVQQQHARNISDCVNTSRECGAGVTRYSCDVSRFARDGCAVPGCQPDALTEAPSPSACSTGTRKRILVRCTHPNTIQSDPLFEKSRSAARVEYYNFAHTLEEVKKWRVSW